MKTLAFWFEFASTYSYLSAMRIDDLAAARGVRIEWRPFLLGPIFKTFGWDTSPFRIYPQKGAYMLRDLERRAARFGLPFRTLDTSTLEAFPQNSLMAARIALIGLKSDWGRTFSRAVFHAEFAEGRNIAGRDLLFALAHGAGATNADLAAAFDDTNKAALRAQTDRAMQLGIFGAPSFVSGDELFWGDDRLEDALDHASGGIEPG